MIGLAVMAAVVAGTSLFGAYWIRVEKKSRLSTNEKPKEQGQFPFAKVHEYATRR